MGTRALSITAAALALMTSVPALAQSTDAHPCRGRTASGSTFVTCFDPGNQLFAQVTNESVGLGIDARHTVETDDPDVSWRLQHAIAHVELTDAHIAGALYSGRFLRHSQDGYLLLPTSPPRKVFVPFDIGMEAEAGRIDRGHDETRYTLGAVRAAILVEFTRSDDFRRRLAIGPVVRWDMSLAADAAADVSAIEEHRVTPFTTGLLDGYWESRDGLTRAQLRVQAGVVWSNVRQWETEVDAEVALERVLIAINDRPLSLFARGGYAHYPEMNAAATGRQIGWRATVGARLAWSWVDRSH